MCTSVVANIIVWALGFEYRIVSYQSRFVCVVSFTMSIDFDLDDSPVSVSKLNCKGKKREYLKIFETMPPVFLNAYGEAKYVKLSDEEVWKAVCEPQKSGAPYATEMASEDVLRRGVGINRFLYAMKHFMEYQKRENVVAQNKAIINDKIREQLYEEIDTIYPSICYILAPKMENAKKGISSLRSSSAQGEVCQKPATEIDKHAKVVYDWLDKGKSSRIRGLASWQACGGVSFTTAVHHRGTQCFRYHGNSLHAKKSSEEVSLSEFQEAVRARMQMAPIAVAEAKESTSMHDLK